MFSLKFIFILVYDSYVGFSIQTLKTDLIKLPGRSLFQLRYFEHQHTKFVWIEERGGFGSLSDLLQSPSLDEIVNSSKGLLETESIEL